MVFIFIAVLLFSLLHPVSKYIFSTGLNIYYFTLYYLFIRALIGIPTAIIIGKKKIKREDILIFVFLGLIGAFIPVSEFIAVYEGVPVSTVSFLIFTLPFWSTILGYLINKEPINKLGILRIILVFIGAVAICCNAANLNFNFKMLIWPILSGLFLSLWVCISKRLRTKEYSPITINGVYDSIAFVFLIIFLSFKSNTSDLIHNLKWLGSISNLITIILYALILGFLANMLVYTASKYVSAIRIGITMSLEPIITTLISIFAFKDTVTFWFLLGSFFLLMANMPDNITYSIINVLFKNKNTNNKTSSKA